MAPRQRETQSAHWRPSPLKAPSHGHHPYHQPSFTLPRPNSFPVCSKRVGSSSGPLPFSHRALPTQSRSHLPDQAPTRAPHSPSQRCSAARCGMSSPGEDMPHCRRTYYYQVRGTFLQFGAYPEDVRRRSVSVDSPQVRWRELSPDIYGWRICSDTPVPGPTLHL